MAVSAKALGLDELPVQEKLDLINELWDGIASGDAAVPISDELAAELERRLAAHKADPSASSSAEEVRRAAYGAIGR